MPDFNWFEFEVVSQLMIERKYGNQILQDLNGKFGEGYVSSGKLYPVLQKMEKRGYIEKVTDVEQTEEKGVTRGVERVYFSLTEKGREQLEKATTYSSNAFMHGLMNKLQREVATRCFEILSKEYGKKMTTGLLKLCWEGPLDRVLKDLELFDEVKFYFLELELEGFKKCELETPRTNLDITRISFKRDDIPLKSDYLDNLILVMVLHDIDNWKSFINECVRIVRPGGMLIALDFAKFDSYILEALMQNFHGTLDDEETLLGMDPEVIIDVLEPHLENILSERMKELLLVYGKKP